MINSKREEDLIIFHYIATFTRDMPIPIKVILNANNTGAITLVQGSGVTMYLAGTTTTGNRTVGPRGIATIVFETSAICYVGGPGVS